MESTSATGSPVGKQGAERQGTSAGELRAAYEARDAELVSARKQADECLSAYEKAVRTWSEAHEAASAAYAAWWDATQLD